MAVLERRVTRLLFFTVLCIALFTMQGKLRDSDEFPMLLTTQAICERGTLAIENLNADENALGEGNTPAGGGKLADDWKNMWFNFQHMKDFHYGARNEEGVLYSKYGIVASFVFVPFWFIGMLLAGMFGLTGADRLSFIVFIAGFTIPILLAWSGVLLFRIGRFMGYGVAVSASLALSLCLCSNMLVYGGMYMSEVTQVFFLLSGWYFLFGFIHGKKSAWWALASALSYSLMMLTKFADMIYVIPLVYIVAVKMGGAITDGFKRFGKGLPVAKDDFRRNSYGLGAMLLGLLIFPLVFYFYNYFRYGNPTETGYISEYQEVYIPIYYGLAGFLISPGKSLFLYFPPAALFFWSIRKFMRGFRIEFWFFVIHAAIQILVYSRFIYWSGFWSWGPRYSLLILPALILPVGMLLDDGKWMRRFRGLCYAGFLVQFPVLIIHFNEFIRLMRNTFGEPLCYYHMFYNPIYSPIIANWWLLVSKVFRTALHVDIPYWTGSSGGYTTTKLFFVTLSRDVPSLSPFFICSAIIFFGGAIYAGLHLRKGLEGIKKAG